MKTQEQEQFEQELFENRITEQKRNRDYDDDMEKCECGMYLNSHGHCPRCDY